MSWKKNLTLIAVSFFVGCSDNDAPPLKKPIELFLGVSQDMEYCRVNTDTLAENVGLSKIEKKIIHKYLDNGDKNECYDVASPDFDKMILISVDDLQYLFDYIRELKFSCKKWKKID